MDSRVSSARPPSAAAEKWLREKKKRPKSAIGARAVRQPRPFKLRKSEDSFYGADTERPRRGAYIIIGGDLPYSSKYLCAQHPPVPMAPPSTGASRSNIKEHARPSVTPHCIARQNKFSRIGILLFPFPFFFCNFFPSGISALAPSARGETQSNP